LKFAGNAHLFFSVVLCVSVRKRKKISRRGAETAEIRLENAFRSGPVDLAGRLAADPLGEGEVIEVVWNAILLCVLCVSARKERILSQRRRDKTGKRFSIRPCQVISDSSIEL